MPNHGARTLRRTLASTCWFLLLAGQSCKYNVTLPWVAEDASTRVLDSSFDQSPPSPPDVATAGSDAFACPGNITRELVANRIAPQIVVAIDRSASMQQKNFDSGTKTQAAWAALNYSSDRHSSVSFPNMSFPGTNCPVSACCANVSFGPGGGRGSDFYGGCGVFDAGCPPPSSDSPSHSVLKQVNANFGNGASWPPRTTLVLITDQTPSCAIETASDACNVANNLAIDIVEQDVRIYVLVPLAEGRGSAPDCLNKIAKQNAPKFPDAQTPILVKTSQELSWHLESIVTGVEERVCHFYVRDLGPDQIEQIRIGARSIWRDDSGTKGWRFGPGYIELSPDECKSLGSQKVIVVACSSGRGQPTNWP
jgi:hypothetical protein